jgi:uncharacterized protein YceK
MIKLLIGLVGVISLSGCSAITEQTDKTGQADDSTQRFVRDLSWAGIRVISDTETGCKYLFVRESNAGGLSPLYKQNGEIDCGQ